MPRSGEPAAPAPSRSASEEAPSPPYYKFGIGSKTPTGDVELDAHMEKHGKGSCTLVVENVGGVSVERVQWIFPPEATNWHVFLESLASYPIPVLEPGDSVRALVALTFGGPAAIEVTLRGLVDGIEYTRKRTLSAT